MKRPAILPFLLLVAVALSGCVVAPPMHHAPAAGIYLPVPRIAVAPAPGHHWTEGRRAYRAPYEREREHGHGHNHGRGWR